MKSSSSLCLGPPLLGMGAVQLRYRFFFKAKRHQDVTAPGEGPDWNPAVKEMQDPIARARSDHNLCPGMAWTHTSAQYLLSHDPAAAPQPSTTRFLTP